MHKLLMASLIFGVCAAGFVGGCQTAPPTEEGRANLHNAVEEARANLYSADPDFRDFLTKSHAYVIFPTVGEGGLIVGGGRGRGEVYRGNEMIGHAQMTFASVGLQAGGQAYTQVIVFEDAAALDRFVNNRFEFTAKASAVALKEGASKAARYTDGVAVFTYVKGGLMAQAALGGQKFSFTPLRY
ncbi:MAG TPA: YSC84-related protein [Tepidisphaeraceae bacterium]|nr:YSC84-related protein [Tepidisphaeraceae bacterium]